MTQAIGNFQPYQQPAAILPPQSNKKMNMNEVEASSENWLPKTPAIGNIVGAPIGTVVAIKSLIQAHANQDKEGKLNASIRLIQQPFAFFSALGSLAMTITELGMFLKTFGFKHIIPLPPKQLGPVVSGLGLVICAFELIFESLGLYRATSFLSQFYCSKQPKLPNFSEIQNSTELKRQIINWTKRLIDSPESLQANLNAADYQALLLRLNALLTALQADEIPISEAEPRAQIEQFLQDVKDQLLLADLKYLHRKYFTVSQSKVEGIRNITRQKFPNLSEAELNTKTDEMASQILTRKGCSLARRVQCWFVRELNEKLEPLMAKFASPDPAVRNQAKAEAKELLETMDIQARKKMIAHIIGIIGVTLLSIGILLGFAACPIIPSILLGIGTCIALGRYFFAAGYWHSRGWNFDPMNCIPSPIRLAYGKIQEAWRIRTEAANRPRPLTEPRLSYFVTSSPYLFPEHPILRYRLSQSALDHFTQSCGLRP